MILATFFPLLTLERIKIFLEVQVHLLFFLYSHLYSTVLVIFCNILIHYQSNVVFWHLVSQASRWTLRWWCIGIHSGSVHSHKWLRNLVCRDWRIQCFSKILTEEFVITFAIHLASTCSKCRSLHHQLLQFTQVPILF